MNINNYLNRYLFYKDKLSKVIAVANEGTVVIETLEERKCEHCGKQIGKEKWHMIPTSNEFKENVTPLQGITEEELNKGL